jgi:hypothetical protein
VQTGKPNPEGRQPRAPGSTFGTSVTSTKPGSWRSVNSRRTTLKILGRLSRRSRWHAQTADPPTQIGLLEWRRRQASNIRSWRRGAGRGTPTAREFGERYDPGCGPRLRSRSTTDRESDPPIPQTAWASSRDASLCGSCPSSGLTRSRLEAATDAVWRMCGQVKPCVCVTACLRRVRGPAVIEVAASTVRRPRAPLRPQGSRDCRWALTCEKGGQLPQTALFT